LFQGLFYDLVGVAIFLKNGKKRLCDGPDEQGMEADVWIRIQGSALSVFQDYQAVEQFFEFGFQGREHVLGRERDELQTALFPAVIITQVGEFQAVEIAGHFEAQECFAVDFAHFLTDYLDVVGGVARIHYGYFPQFV
jgi:hypothetical protein